MMLHNDYGKKKYNDIDFMTTHNSSSNLYASLDDAFRQPPIMNDIQQKINREVISDENFESEHNMLTPQTEEKINHSVDKMMTSNYDMLPIYEEHASLSRPNIAKGTYPLNTSRIVTGSNYIPLQYAYPEQHFYENIYSSSHFTTKLFKFIVILIVLIVLICGGYIFYKKYSESTYPRLHNTNILNKNIGLEM